MRIGGIDNNVPIKAAVSSENAVKAVAMGNTSPGRETDLNEESVANWRVSDSFLKKVVEKANQTMAIQNRYLEFRIHEKTNEIIVKVVDRETNEVIREIPSEKILDMFASMLEIAGLLVDERR